MNDSLFSSAVESERLRAQQLATDGRASQFFDGKDAFALASNQRVPRNLGEVLLAEGDTFTIPTDENSKQWLATPLSKGGDPVLRLLAEVKDKNGNVRFVQVFIGTLLKSVRNRETKGQVLADVKFKDGSSFRAHSAGFANQQDCWRFLFGKTLKVTAVDEVPTIGRNYQTGARFEKDAQVLTFEEV